MITLPLSVQLSQNIFALDVSLGHEEFSEKYFTQGCLQVQAVAPICWPMRQEWISTGYGSKDCALKDVWTQVSWSVNSILSPDNIPSLCETLRKNHAWLSPRRSPSFTEPVVNSAYSHVFAWLAIMILCGTTPYFVKAKVFKIDRTSILSITSRSIHNRKNIKICPC